MSPAWIRVRDVPASRRTPKARRSYSVLYRRGGRGYPIETAGSFRTEREAKIRRDLVGGWLAAGLNPKVELARMAVAPVAVLTISRGIQTFTASRVDASANTVRVIRQALKHLRTLEQRDPVSVKVADLQEIVTASELAPATLGTYVTYWAMLFDFLEVDPNPARSRHLRLPKQVAEQVAPPTTEQFLAAVESTPFRYHLPLVTLEQTGMRIGELVSLAWGDVDEAGFKFRLRAQATKTRRSRWVQVPDWLMPIISATCAVEDRSTGRLVFQGFTGDRARQALATACAAAGVPHFTPHDLRHRRATIWHHSGLPTRVLMERGGWTKSEIPLEVYSHLMPIEEAPRNRLEALLVVAG